MTVLSAVPEWAQQQPADLTRVNVEDLMNMEVTSVSRKDQRLSRVAPAIFVITQEDIRRSGATNIPDLLRMVPGADAAQINANAWAITARGFNAGFGNELLVMVDGQAVYIPTFGGVFWDVLGFPLEDIERIEAIRGPGGSVWGANAVNGVINIITKKASETKGAIREDYVAILNAGQKALNLTSKMRRPLRNPGHGIRGEKVCHLASKFAIAALGSLLVIAGGRWVSAQSNPSGEYQVKAAFLFHFAQFVDWPPEAFKDAASPLTYCTVGEDPFHGALDASLNGKTIDGRPVRVLHFKLPQEVQPCQILFLGAPEKKSLSATLVNLGASPVLTVGESQDFIEQGGMIGFLWEDNKVHFEINLEAAERAKLKISARLLTLAKKVIGGPKGT
jgi:hypothetical protein